MANLINVDRVGKGYDAAGQLLTDVSLGIGERDRIGVVGLNGAGKSTLLRLLTKAEPPDAGRVTHRRDLRVAALPQSLTFTPTATVGEIVLGTAWLGSGFAAEHEWAGDAAVRTILSGLGLPGLGLQAPVGPMSGGERRRVALAALLVRHADVLVLDEPTNHLDVAGVDFLARHLLDRRGALVVVTHDRWFLDTVCNQTWEVADATVRAYEGGYAAWTLARAERARQAAAAEARRQNLLRKEIAWLRRGPPARTSKPKFRIEAANALIADEPPPRDSVSLRRLATARLGKLVYELEDVRLYAGQRLIFDQLSWQIGPGDRIAVVGANGAGKTSLLRLLAGELHPSGGRVRVGQTVRPAYLSQELAELPDEQRTLTAVEQVARRVRMGDRELTAAQLAELFGFRGDRLWTPVADLSGGERRRLQLLRLLAGEPNVLLLDEPTNDLDTDTLAGLEDLLDSWPGSLVVASHDRYLIERVADTVYGLYGDGGLRHLPGGVEEYLAGLASAGAAAPGQAARAGGGSNAAAAPAGGGKTAAAPAGGGKAAAAPAGGSSNAAAARAARKELARLERQINRLTQQEAALHTQLAAHATDYTALAALDAELQQVRAQRLAAEESWLELAGEYGDG